MARVLIAIVVLLAAGVPCQAAQSLPDNGACPPTHPHRMTRTLFDPTAGKVSAECKGTPDCHRPTKTRTFCLTEDEMNLQQRKK